MEHSSSTYAIEWNWLLGQPLHHKRRRWWKKMGLLRHRRWLNGGM